MCFTSKLISAICLVGTTCMAASYTQDFDSDVMTFRSEMPLQVGGTGPNLLVSLDKCLLGGNNADLIDQGDNNFALRPNKDTKANGRFSFITIDVTDWKPGSYTLQFDFIGADNGGSRLYIGEAYGYELMDVTPPAIIIDGFADGFKKGADTHGYGIFGINGATANHLVDIDLDGVGGANETVSRTISQKFNISEKATLIVIGFGSYDSGFMIDNIEVIGEAPLATLGLVTG